MEMFSQSHGGGNVGRFVRSFVGMEMDWERGLAGARWFAVDWGVFGAGRANCDEDALARRDGRGTSGEA